MAFRLPGDDLRRLVGEREAFRRHFDTTFIRNIQAVRQSGGVEEGQLRSVPAFPDLAAQMRSRVADIMSHQVLTCPPEATIRQAAQQMTQ